jgi:hypothetical protein
MDDIKTDSKTSVLDQAKLDKSQTRKPYVSPRLEKLGRFRDLTLGGSVGTGDSGSPLSRAAPGMP